MTRRAIVTPPNERSRAIGARAVGGDREARSAVLEWRDAAAPRHRKREATATERAAHFGLTVERVCALQRDAREDATAAVARDRAACPVCRASVGQPCHEQGFAMILVHRARIASAEAVGRAAWERMNREREEAHRRAWPDGPPCAGRWVRHIGEHGERRIMLSDDDQQPAFEAVITETATRFRWSVSWWCEGSAWDAGFSSTLLRATERAEAALAEAAAWWASERDAGVMRRALASLPS